MANIQQRGIKKCVFNAYVSVFYSDLIGVPPRGAPVQVDYVFKIIGAHFVCKGRNALFNIGYCQNISQVGH